MPRAICAWKFSPTNTMLPAMFLFVVALFALPVPEFPVDEIVRGQRGVCKTVFESDVIEPMAFEVKGVMRHYLGPNEHVVLIRLLGDKPAFTGVVAGMSGSPCYLEGRLIGALSYAFSAFAKEPIAGVTPIGRMRDVLRLPPEAVPARQLGENVTNAPLPAQIEGGRLTPIATPLCLSGVPLEALAGHDDWLRAHHLALVPGGGAPQASAGQGSPLVPGSAVSVVMVRGDVDMAATGTVTEVDGARVLAFGHPFMSSGAVSFPMAKANILNTMVSLQRSFKMSQTGSIVGEVTQDRLTAIAGVMGPSPSMMPVTGRFTRAGHSAPFAFEVARDLAMTPRLAGMALGGVILGRAESGARGTLYMEGNILLPNEAPIPLSFVMAAERDAQLASGPGMELARALGELWRPPFGPPKDVRVEVEVTLVPAPRRETVESVEVTPPQLYAGGKACVHVHLRDAQGGLEILHLPLSIPRAWADQAVVLWVSGTSAAQLLLDEIGGDLASSTQEATLAKERDRLSAGSLEMLALRPGAGLAVGARRFDHLPPSAVTLFAAGQVALPLPLGVASHQRFRRPGVVEGAGHIRLFIKPNVAD